METQYFLFDIDGVLLKPGGYRKASNETLRHFLTRYGFQNLPSFDEYFTRFEAIGITSEWDMLPLFLAAGLEQSFRQHQLTKKLNNWSEIQAFVQEHQGVFSLSEFQLERYAKFLMDGVAPAEAVLNKVSSVQFFEDFPMTSSYCVWIFEDLLFDTRNPANSEITAVFQNLILGDRLFETVIGQPAAFKTDSYLVLHDQNNLGSEETQKVLDLFQAEKIYCAAMTARPSGYPDGDAHHPLYFPEAELGLKAAAFERIPVIGYGGLIYLSEKFGETGDYYLKPAPIHALAAILASRGMTIVQSVTRAYGLMNTAVLHAEQQYLLDTLFPSGTVIHIFEDSAIGLRSVKQLAVWLTQAGYSVEARCYGISTDEHKINALKKENAAIYEHINAALKQGLGRLKG